MYYLKQIVNRSDQIFRNLAVYLVDNQLSTPATDKVLQLHQKIKEMDFTFVAAVSPKGDYRKIMEIANQKLLEEKLRKEEQSQNEIK